MGHRWNPVRDLVTLQDRMNRLFEESARQREARGGEDEAEAEMERADWYPAADVFETEQEFIVALDLPGISRDTLDVMLDEDRLTIRGERVAFGEGASQRRAERPTGRFVRSFSLPAVVERESIAADYKDGVLALHLPKRVERQTRRVEIKVS
jgi:HSP20 family protein